MIFIFPDGRLGVESLRDLFLSILFLLPSYTTIQKVEKRARRQNPKGCFCRFLKIWAGKAPLCQFCAKTIAGGGVSLVKYLKARDR